MHCPHCFEEKEGQIVCPFCQFDESGKRSASALPYRTLLHNQYLIGHMLGKPGGFGITYLGYDTRLETKVAIKEFLPRDWAARDTDRQTVLADDDEMFQYGLEQFLREARILAKFDHAHIVRVRSFFEEFGTAYMVMDYYDGLNLEDYLAQQSGRLNPDEAVAILMPVMDGLREIHQMNVLHRDIKPQNIYITTQGRPILLDFGAARQALTLKSRSLSVVLTDGFAPPEQYDQHGQQGPWTDVYGAAATLYYLITGVMPPSATERIIQDRLVLPKQCVPALSDSLNQAILQALSLSSEFRPQNMQAFQNMITGQAALGPLPSVRHQIPTTVFQSSMMNQSESRPQQGPMPQTSLSPVIIMLSVVVLLLFGIAGFLGYQSLYAKNAVNTQQPAMPTMQAPKVVPSTTKEAASPESAVPEIKQQAVPEAPVATEDVRRVVYSFYTKINQHDMNGAYNQFSSSWKSQVSYSGWIKGYNNTISNHVEFANVMGSPTWNDSKATVAFSLLARDRDYGRIHVQRFQGEWHLVREEGQWKLDDASVQKAGEWYE